ncbi:DNA topology modulation protein [Bacillus luteolus]|uniref:DNA topology modulation protein n=1 Tax=Litchfieldia luteola TaxID=682179 RepID=A0ABR9QN28_9BACI|nr:DNA topology modulation protein [Cytobacillus luteolus]MBE4909849.1 DNA topology modulation protein [Cytobacillus luteolus]MBP1942602.1 adenylate kinase family enzyme [Cytobacillus luteolus]
MIRIAIIGSGGSGKSTLARKMGDKLNLEVWHLDRLLWKPNWQLTTREEQREIQNELIAKDKWIIDGNYTRTLDIRLNAADTILFLDISKVICVTRVVKRMIKFRNSTRPDMNEGCNEKIDLRFIKWVWKFPKTQRPYILTKLEQLSTNKEIIVLKSPKEIQRFLDNL